MERQLEELFGCKIEIQVYDAKLSLPIYMTMRKINLISIYGISFAVVDIINEDSMTVAAMKKQLKQYEDALKYHVAFNLVVDSRKMRNALVRNGIPFIDLPGNMFLPFLGILLQDKYEKKTVKSKKMMPATQQAFLMLLYLDDGETILKSEMARRLHLTKTSITRVTMQLKEMELINEHKSGTEISIKRNMPRHEYYERARSYLINPVQRTLTVLKSEVSERALMAGETALSISTDLNPPIIEELAVFKGHQMIDGLEEVDPRFEDAKKCVKVQLWKYDPFIFETEGVVDPISLICTFSGNEDERIEMSIEQLLEEL